MERRRDLLSDFRVFGEPQTDTSCRYQEKCDKTADHGRLTKHRHLLAVACCENAAPWSTSPSERNPKPNASHTPYCRSKRFRVDISSRSVPSDTRPHAGR